MNPVKANMVPNPWDYEWSSCAERKGLAVPVLKLEKLTRTQASELGRRYDSPDRERAIAANNDPEAERVIAGAIMRNQLTGTTRFYDEIERKIGRRVSNKSPGCPAASNNKK